ncbi:acyltransferase [Streptomyces alkaliterrae]|uniref:Acyltransferase n=1 Tax=Streptomyces alkaliterrae TaxID=2213162 RepID=A0A5P0YYV2_9ACTN|nr:acyltransferase [Streptomyces alkaliterrae]MBB1261148.1 acyltransferase [Streptomyces alkaliterrae]MQS03649.1 acyltransferase family protein [Streptomyces alkaliterrae]
MPSNPASASATADGRPTAPGVAAQPLPAPAAEHPTTGTVATPRAEDAARREHRADVDLMRLVCSCAVMLGHVGATFVHAVDRQEANGSGAYWVGHLADSANEFAVPMYFALAGWAVLVGAPPKDGPTAWRRVTRNGLPLLVWTVLYLAWAWLRGRNEEPMTDLAVASAFGSVRPAYHLWFMYTYLPLIAVLAFALLVWAGRRPWGLGAALLAVAVAPSVVGTVGELTGWETPPVKWGFGTYSLVYAVVGALLFALPRGVPARYRWLLVPGFLATWAACLWYNTQVHYVIANAHLFVALMTGCVLLFVCRIRVPERWRPRLAKLAGAALGAYMVHVLVVEELVRPLVRPDLGAGAAGLLLVGSLAATVVLSYAASLLWGRLRLRRWLG